jgi:7-cyano-7-deazaguanine synthase
MCPADRGVAGAGRKESAPAVVLVSGGLDSATVLGIARRSFACHALTFDYGQRHKAELAAARRICTAARVAEHQVFPVGLSTFGHSALTDTAISVPLEASKDIPATYVPARNTVFLAIALAYAEVRGAEDVFLGVNALDYSGYPDCRPEYLRAFEAMAGLATKAGVQGKAPRLHAPLLYMSKAEIIRLGLALKLDYELTVSCYQADEAGRACAVCDACRLRAKGFAEAGIEDPTRYRAESVG